MKAIIRFFILFPLIALALQAQTSLVITNPAQGAAFTAPANITINATAIDPKGYISRVEFYANDQGIGVSELAFFRAPDPGTPIFHTLNWTNVAANIYVLTVRATDSQKLSVTSAPVKIAVTAAAPPPPASAAERALPLAYMAGIPVTVQIKVVPSPGTKAYGLEDQPPAGWLVVTNISNDGVFDAVTGKVKFGPYFDDQVRTVRYDVVPPKSATTAGKFQGITSFDGGSVTIGGQAEIVSASPHPADIKPPDNIMTLPEVTAYGQAWKNGTRWPVEPNPIPMSYVTRAASLWRGGEAYTFDPSFGSAPLWWVNKPKIAAQSVAAPSRAYRYSSQPGEITVRIEPGDDVLAYAVTEQPGGTITDVGQDGTIDSSGVEIHWGPFFDNLPRTLTYKTQGPSNSALIGAASFDGADLPIVSAPVVKSARLISTGEIEIEALNSGGALPTQVLEESEDLIKWTEVTSNALSAASWSTRLKIGAFRKFYRVRVN